MIAITDGTEQAMNLYKTDEEFGELERHMMAAIKAKPKTPPKRPNRPGLPPAENIEEIIRICDNAYDSNELSSMSNMYAAALEVGIDWIPSVKARMALGCAAAGQIDSAITLATESYQEHPEEIDAYWALSFLMKFLNSPFQARKWFDLFKKGSQTMKYGAIEYDKMLEAEIRQFARKEAMILKILTTPKYFEEMKRQDIKLEHFIKEDKASEGLQRVQEDPTPENLRKELSQNLGFRYTVFSLYKNDNCQYPFETLSGDELAKSLAESAPLFAKWDENLASYFVRYLHTQNGWKCLANLQTTCKPLRDLFNRSKVWENVLSVLPTIMGQQGNMTDGLPPRMASRMGATPKNIVKNWHFCISVLFKLSQASSDFSKVPSDQLLAVCERFDFAPIGPLDALTTLGYRMIDLLALAEDAEAWDFAVIPIFNLITSDLTFTARVSTFLDLVSLFALKARRTMPIWSVPCVSSLFPHVTQHYTRACATTAMLRGGEWFTKFNVRALAPSEPTRSVNMILNADLDLSGIYHTIMAYDHPDLYGCCEKGVTEVSFTSNSEPDTNGSFSGKGVDTLGSYTFSTEVTFDMGQSDISWVQKYDNGVSLRFVGVLQPSGFGGFFGHLDETSDPENPSILGYWAMVMDKTPQSEFEGAMKAFKKQVTQEMEKRKTWKIQQPLTYTEINPLTEAVMALTEVRMQHQILSSPHSPTDAIYSIASQFANSISPLQDVLAEPPQRAVWETDMKYSLRTDGLKLAATALVQARLQIYFHCKSKIKPALLILKNAEHPKFLETYAWWSYHLKLSTTEAIEWFVTEMETILSHMETMGVSADEEVQQKDSDFSSAVSNHRSKGKKSGISTNTFLALSAIGIAALSIGAFLVGRTFASKNQD